MGDIGWNTQIGKCNFEGDFNKMKKQINVPVWQEIGKEIIVGNIKGVSIIHTVMVGTEIVPLSN